MSDPARPVDAAGRFTFPGTDLTVARMGFGAMQLAGPGVFGPPKDEAAAKVLKTRTLTNLYNARPAWLDHAHKALDEAVAEAYGWGDDWRAGALTDDEILARLFKLNQERAG